MALGLGKNTCNLGEGRSLTIINLRAPSTSEGFGPSKPGPNTFLEGAWSPRARKHTSISLGFGRPIFHSHPDSPKMSPPVPCPNALADQLLLVASWMTIYTSMLPTFLRSTIQTRRHGLVFGAHGPGCFPEETQFSSINSKLMSFLRGEVTNHCSGDLLNMVSGTLQTIADSDRFMFLFHVGLRSPSIHDRVFRSGRLTV